MLRLGFVFDEAGLRSGLRHALKVQTEPLPNVDRENLSLTFARRAIRKESCPQHSVTKTFAGERPKLRENRKRFLTRESGTGAISNPAAAALVAVPNPLVIR